MERSAEGFISNDVGFMNEEEEEEEEEEEDMSHWYFISTGVVFLVFCHGPLELQFAKWSFRVGRKR